MSGRAERAEALARLDRLAWWLDSAVGIPGTGFRFGLDGLVGLVPGVGDGATALVSLYIVAEARRLGVPMTGILRMLSNVLVDVLIGAIPLVGDLFDLAFKCNRRNLALARRYVEKAFPEG